MTVKALECICTNAIPTTAMNITRGRQPVISDVCLFLSGDYGGGVDACPSPFPQNNKA